MSRTKEIYSYSYFTNFIFADREKSQVFSMEHQYKKIIMPNKHLWDQCLGISLLSRFNKHIHHLQLIEMLGKNNYYTLKLLLNNFLVGVINI